MSGLRLAQRITNLDIVLIELDLDHRIDYWLWHSPYFVIVSWANTNYEAHESHGFRLFKNATIVSLALCHQLFWWHRYVQPLPSESESRWTRTRNSKDKFLLESRPIKSSGTVCGEHRWALKFLRHHLKPGTCTKNIESWYCLHWMDFSCQILNHPSRLLIVALQSLLRGGLVSLEGLLCPTERIKPEGLSLYSLAEIVFLAGSSGIRVRQSRGVDLE